MARSILAVLERTSRGWRLAVAVAAFAILLYLISFATWVPFSAAHIRQISGGHEVLDLMFGYGPAAGAAALEALGPAGRAAYDGFQLVDIVFPASYAIGLGSLILALGRPWPRLRWLALVPVVGAVFDYVENLGVFVALRGYPDPSAAALVVASAAGVVKTILSDVAQVLVVAGVLARVGRALVRRRRGTRNAV